MTIQRPEHGISRDASIDAMRFILFCAVVILHMFSSSDVTRLQVSSLIDALMRFAVPCFFMVSGYFVPAKIENIPAYIGRNFKRLLIPFFFWELIYNFLCFSFQLGDADPIEGKAGVIKFFVKTIYGGGVAFHLWFLPYLWLCLAIFVVARKGMGMKPVLVLALGLYVAGLAMGPYNGVVPYVRSMVESILKHPWQHPELYTARNGPFFGVLYVWLGAWLSQHRQKLPYGWLLCGAALGYALELLELDKLCSDTALHNGTNIDFLAGTIVYSVSIFLLLRQLRYPCMEKCAKLGRQSLGMYCVHGIFILLVSKYLKTLLPVDDAFALMARGLLACLIISMSAFLAFYGQRMPGLRKLFA